MPGGDGTGPFGDGPRTGWGLGYCAGGRPQDYRGGFGRGGLGRRRAAGDRSDYPPRIRARGRRYFGLGRETRAVGTGRQEVDDMRAEILGLRAELDRILERLDAGRQGESDTEE